MLQTLIGWLIHNSSLLFYRPQSLTASIFCTLIIRTMDMNLIYNGSPKTIYHCVCNLKSCVISLCQDGQELPHSLNDIFFFDNVWLNTISILRSSENSMRARRSLLQPTNTTCSVMITIRVRRNEHQLGLTVSYGNANPSHATRVSGCCYRFSLYFELILFVLEYSWRNKSISWLLMSWRLASPGHQQPWYWLDRIKVSLSSMGKDFNNICHLSVEIFKKLQIHFGVASNNSACKGLKLDAVTFLPVSLWYWSHVSCMIFLAKIFVVYPKNYA